MITNLPSRGFERLELVSLLPQKRSDVLLSKKEKKRATAKGIEK